MKNKVLKGLFVLLVLSMLFVFSCNKTGSKDGSAGDAVANAEAIMQEEMKETPPDWVFPYKEVKDMVVEGMPEEVTWITADTKDYGSKDTKVGGTFHSWIDAYPNTFRYVGPESNNSTRDLMWTQANTVYYLSETQTYIPYAASHWAFGADGKTVYFKLRENIKWSDGEPCTAEDFKYQIDCFKNPNLMDPWYNEWYSKYEVTVYNDYLFSVTYNQDGLEPSELLDACNIDARAKHFFDNKPLEADWYKEYNWKPEPTTGPYVMKPEENIDGQMLVYERVDNWWAREIPYFKHIGNVQRIEYHVISGGSDMIENYFYDQKIDNYNVMIPEVIRRSETKESVVNGYIDRYRLTVSVMAGLDASIFFNTKYYLFSDVNARRAMYYAIDMQGMIDQALYGEYKRYHNIGIGHVYQGVSFDDDTIRKPDFDPEKAKELLAKAGFITMGNDGILVDGQNRRATFELLYSAKNHTDRLSILVEQAKKAGVEITLKLMEDGGAAFQLMRKKQYQAYWGGYNTRQVPDYYEYFSSTDTSDHMPQSNNVFDYGSPEMDKLVRAARDEGDLQKKAELAKQIQRLVDKEALLVPGYYVDYRFSLVWKWIRVPAWGANSLAEDWLDPMSGWLWIDTDIEKEVKNAMSAGETFEPRYYKLTERYAH